MTKEKLKLDYEELVKSYWTNLNELLRSFSVGVDFLELWVPDDDHVKSILNLLEAAQSDKQDTLTLYISPSILESLDLDQLKESVNSLGEMEVSPEESGVLLEVSCMQEWALFQSVHPAYRAGIRKSLKSESYDHLLSHDKDLELIQASDQGVTLMILCDTTSHLIQKASYHGRTSPIQKGVFNALCQILNGLTPLEASDHAIIYLEYHLKDSYQPSPVSGIVTPKNADPIFHLPQKLTRDILYQYRKAIGYNETKNFFIHSVSESWKNLSTSDKLEYLHQSLQKICAKFPIKASEIEILEIEDDVKLTLRVQSDLPSHEKAAALMEIENCLKKQVEFQLQFQLEELKDKNIIRRLQ